jgi:hypothetical protein
MRGSAAGALLAGLCLMIAPAVAALGANPVLTEAAHLAVFSYGAILVIRGVSALTDLRSKAHR